MPRIFSSKKNKSKKKFMNLMRNVPNGLSKYLNANELSKLENISIQTKNSIPLLGVVRNIIHIIGIIF